MHNTTTRDSITNALGSGKATGPLRLQLNSDANHPGRQKKKERTCTTRVHVSVLHIIYIYIYMSFLFFFLFRTLFVKARLFFLFLSLRHCIFSTKSSQDGGQTGTSSSSVAPGKKCTWQLSGTHSRKSHPAEKKARQQAWILVLFFVFFFSFFFSTVLRGCACCPRSPETMEGRRREGGASVSPKSH